ncbi:hypothetical protein D3C86_1216710 [compost metagenome]
MIVGLCFGYSIIREINSVTQSRTFIVIPVVGKTHIIIEKKIGLVRQFVIDTRSPIKISVCDKVKAFLLKAYRRIKISKFLSVTIPVFSFDVIHTKHGLPTQVVFFAIQKNLRTRFLIFVEVVIDIEAGIHAFHFLAIRHNIND